mmetsp:Transcript_18113/g.49413  ORF Transcript_18113/g.49413 Transcript_18113/m.49413 type:complete len:272 (+) Transcript_18113:100-915(+)
MTIVCVCLSRRRCLAIIVFSTSRTTASSIALLVVGASIASLWRGGGGCSVRIVDTKSHAKLLLLKLRHLPRFMNVVVRNVLKLRQPMANVVSVLIVVLALLHNVEPIDPTTSHSSTRAPIVPIRVDIVVDQVLFKKIAAVSPILLQVETQEGANVLTSAIAHKPRCYHFSHIRIHQGVSCFPLFPSSQRWLVYLPCFLWCLRRSRKNPIGVENAIAVLEAKKFAVVAPEQLKDYPIGRLVLNSSFFFVSLAFLCNITWTDTTKCEPGAKFG